MNRLDEHLLELRLTGMLEALQHQRAQPKHYLDLSFEERLSLLVAQEVMLRQQRKIERLTKQADFRLQAHPEQMDYRAERPPPDTSQFHSGTRSGANQARRISQPRQQRAEECKGGPDHQTRGWERRPQPHRVLSGTERESGDD